MTVKMSKYPNSQRGHIKNCQIVSKTPEVVKAVENDNPDTYVKMEFDITKINNNGI